MSRSSSDELIFLGVQKDDMLSGSIGATRPSRMVIVAAKRPTTTMTVARIVSPTSPPHDVDMYSPTFIHRPHTVTRAQYESGR